MNIIAFTDKPGSAIDRIAQINAKRLPHLNYKVLSFHPKRPSQQEIDEALQAIRLADIIDFQYWKSGTGLRKMFPNEFEGKILVLNHHNEHNIYDTQKDHWDWKDFTWHAHVCKNGWQKDALISQGIKPLLIKHSIEFDNFSYVPKLTDKKVVGYVGQIKKVKGVKEIAQACKELGYEFLIGGSVSEAEYFNELMSEFGDTVKFMLPAGPSVPDTMIGDLYSRMSVYCANSDDGTESGTMPILEAMLSGIPVVTRKIGLVRDCGEHSKNMWIRNGGMKDVADLKDALKMMVENADVANSLREAAWRSVRQYHPDKQSREYELLFRDLMHPGKTTVSIIMPTAGRNDVLFENITSLLEQSYKNFEVVICDDNRYSTWEEPIRDWVKENRNIFHFPIKHVKTEKSNDSYGLAKARNMGIIEATGKVLVFCDDRLQMHPQAISSFVTNLEKSLPMKKVWLWGSKGVFKTFVENFSASWRRSIIDAGMFNEEITHYGGMTQEISGRYNAQGFSFIFCASSVADPIYKTHSKSERRDDIIKSKIKLYKMGFQ